MREDFLVFDSHTHLGNVEFGFLGKENPFTQYPSKTSSDKANYMATFGVDRCLVVPFYTYEATTPYKYCNPVITECVKTYDNILGALWFTPNTNEEEYLDGVFEEIEKNEKICALKTTVECWEKDFTPDPKTWDREFKKIMSKVIDLCISKKIPIQFHCSRGRTGPSHFNNLFKEYPDLTIHLVHMGMDVGTHFEFIPLFLKWLTEGHNVYCDTSLALGFAVRWLIDELLAAGIGTDRVLFGTDEPWGAFPAEFYKISCLEISQEVKQNILYNNANELYKVRAVGQENAFIVNF